MNDLQVARDLRNGAAYIRTHGWHQGGIQAPDGRVCAVGGVYFGSNERCYIIPPLFNDLPGVIASSAQHALAQWNDMPGRKVEEVLDLLESTALALEIRALAADKTESSSKELEVAVA